MKRISLLSLFRFPGDFDVSKEIYKDLVIRSSLLIVSNFGEFDRNY